MRWIVLSSLTLLLGAMPAQARDRYDPTTDPNVASYLVCIQLSSGGGDNSDVPDVSNFDDAGYVTWSNGLGKFILCQEVDKS